MSWAALMHAASTAYGVPPEAFWRLSLTEWRALTTAGGRGVPPLTRGELDALMAAHPDQPYKAGAAA